MLDLLFQINIPASTNSADITDWIRAVASGLGIPVAIWGIIKLFRKDLAQERKLSSLEELARSQVEANDHLRGQVHQLKMTTSTLEEHSHYYAGNLTRLTEQSIEMFKQTQLIAESNTITEKRLQLEIDSQKEYLEVQYEVTKEFFLSTILSLEKALIKQVQNGREFADTVALQRLTDFTLNFSLGANEMVATNFSLERLFRIFVVQGKGPKAAKAEAFVKLVRAVEYLKVFKQMCQQELTMYAEKIARYDANWREAFGNVHGSYEILLRDVSRVTAGNIQTDSLMRGLADVVIGWQKSPPADRDISHNDPFYVVDAYITPFKEVCRTHALDPRVETFLPDLVKAEMAVREMKHLKSSTSAFFTRVSDDLEGILNDFMDVYAFHATNP